MVGTLSVTAQRWTSVPWQWWAAAFLLVVPNSVLLFSSLQWIRESPYAVDWWMLQEAASRIGTGTMYEWGEVHRGDVYSYTYSPLLPYLTVLSLPVWRALHVIVLVVLPRTLALVLLISGPFWFDVANGNFLTFALVFGWLALDGKRWAVIAYFALMLLVPRPLMLPVAVWLVWERPESRLPAVATVVVLTVATLLTGEAWAWAEALTRGMSQVGADFDIGPSRFIGAWWWPLGLVIGAWALWKGRLGIASLAVSPYILPHYLLMAFLEARRRS